MRTMRCLAALALVVTTGCLSTSHAIPRGELMRLAQAPPAERGERVRVVQAFAGNNQPHAQAVRADAVLVVDTGVHVHAGPPVRAPRSPGTPHPGAAQVAKQDAKHWLVVAATIAVALAFTEGARYDGWARLHPMHPVHLYGGYGEYRRVPLAQLDAGTASWARRAYVVTDEGPWQPLGRAPLNRQGFAYAVQLGRGEIAASDRTVAPGPLGRIELGYFPSKTLGVMGSLGLGWRDHALGSTVYENRAGLGLRWFPIIAGPLHLGLLGEAGISGHVDDAPMGRDSGTRSLGAGAIFELELTTRLALSARATSTLLHGEWFAELLAGLTIY